MVEIDISDDIEHVMRGVDDFWRRQIPFATSQALNATIKDVKRYNENVTYRKAFEVRNPTLARVLWRMRFAKKSELEAVLFQALDRDWVADHVDGGTKRPRGNRIAVPIKPALVRGNRGAVRPSLKPRPLRDQKNTYMVNNVLYMRRKGFKEGEALYVFVETANIPKRFYFYRDATAMTLKVFGGHWVSAMNRSIRSSRFYDK